MSELFVLCFGTALGYICGRARNYFELNDAYGRGQKYGYEQGLLQGKEASHKLKFYGENEKRQVVFGLMEIRSMDEQ